MTVSLLPFNTFNIDQSCQKLIRAKSKQELINACLVCIASDEPFLVLGGGSNVVLIDDFAGSVILIETKGIATTEDEDNYYLAVAAGEDWHALVEYTLKHQMSGLENLALIPGVTGAAPIQNIGAYGVEFCDYCAWVEYLDLDTGNVMRLQEAQCQFSYRESIFKQSLHGKAVITEVGLKLPKIWLPKLEYGPLKSLDFKNVDAKTIFETVCKIRSTKLPDPNVLGNAGSFFKNPIISLNEYYDLKKRFPELVAFVHGVSEMKLAAGWLIEHAGLKGYRQDNVGVHAEQALVLVNYGDAKGSDICRLAKHVITKVKNIYGVTLEPEPRIITAYGEGEMI